MIEIDDNVVMIPLDRLKEHPLNKIYHSAIDEGSKSILINDIKENGIRYPILVNHDFTVLSGNTRCEILRELGNKEIPARMVKCSEEEAVFLLVAENKARRDTERDLIKKARQIKLLYERWGIRQGRQSVHGAHDKTRHDVAEQVGMSDSNARRYMQLLNLSEELQKQVSEGNIKFKAGVKLSRLSKEEQRRFYKRVTDREKIFPQMSTNEVNKIITLMEENNNPTEIKRVTQLLKEDEEINRFGKKVVSMMTGRHFDRETAEKLLVIFESGVKIMQAQITEGEDNIGKTID